MTNTGYGIGGIVTPDEMDLTKDYAFLGILGSLGATLYGDGSNITNVGAAAATSLTVAVEEEGTGTIYKGQVVYVSGAAGKKTFVGLASCTDAAKIRVIGIASDDILIGQEGFVRHRGILGDVDTRNKVNSPVNPNQEDWAAGDLLYLANNTGGMTNVIPTSGRVIKVAYSLQGSSSSDELLVIAEENPIYIACADGEDIELRMGDDAGVNKIIFENYLDAEVASLDSLGNLIINTINSVAGNTIESTDNKGAASGYAPLGADSLVPSANLPAIGNVPITLLPASAIIPITAGMEKFKVDGTNVSWVELRAEKPSVLVETAFWEHPAFAHLAGVSCNIDVWWYGTRTAAEFVKWQIWVLNRTTGQVIDVAPTSVGVVETQVDGTTLELVKSTITGTPFTAGNECILQIKRIASAGTELAEDARLWRIDISPA